MEAICQVSLDAVTQNYLYFKKRANPAHIIPVVKANAYGHGAIEITRHLHLNLGVRTFAVATLEEAHELSEHFPEISILIFSRVFASELGSVPENAILTVGSMEDARALSSSSTRRMRVHLNINTGMNRLGLTSEEVLDLTGVDTPNIQIEGIYSHFSSSDTDSQVAYLRQSKIFKLLVEKLKANGFSGIYHMANSAAILAYGETPFDAMRLGIGLYGYDTTPKGQHGDSLRPVMAIKAPLIRIHRVKAGESVSYAEKWQSAVDTNIGTLRIGYADGYSRALTNRGVVSHNEKTYSVVGTVTMDHIMIDLGQDDPQTGEMFNVLGGENSKVQVQTISKILDTIPYEICCGISPRVKRKFQP